MEGVGNVKALFDIRVGNPKVGTDLMKLVWNTYQNLKAMGKKPTFAVVFIGGAVKLISSKRNQFTPKAQNYLKQLDDTIAKMAKAGIRLEVCLTAVRYLKVDPSTLPVAIKQVPNGWISEIGYQAKGYSLVPVY